MAPKKPVAVKAAASATGNAASPAGPGRRAHSSAVGGKRGRDVPVEAVVATAGIEHSREEATDNTPSGSSSRGSKRARVEHTPKATEAPVADESKPTKARTPRAVSPASAAPTPGEPAGSKARRPSKKITAVAKAAASASIKPSAPSDSLDRAREAKYLQQQRGGDGGAQFIIGVDEAGRGPLAGPVVAAACVVLPGARLNAAIRDSKQTTEEEREAAFEELTHSPDVMWCACRVEHDEIDSVNILQATMLAMRRATEGLLAKYALGAGTGGHAGGAVAAGKGKKKDKAAVAAASGPALDPSKCIALIDGNRAPEGMPVPWTEWVIKGDSLIYSIAAASIIAKVTRDRIMVELDEKYPQYNFSQHKGYPTFEHRSLLMAHGPSRVHRYSYRPVYDAARARGFPIPAYVKAGPAAAAAAAAAEGEGDSTPAKQKGIKGANSATTKKKTPKK